MEVFIRRARMIHAGFAVFLAASGCWVGHAQEKPIELSGTVMDQGHEPLKGAVVQVQDDKTQQVVSYLTDRAGHYDFKRLMGGEDYHYWATYRGHKSRVRTLSMFGSKTAVVMTLAIKLH